MSDQNRDQKSEAPTQRRIQKSNEDGKFGFSSELVGSLILVSGILFFWVGGTWFFHVVADCIRRRIYSFDQVIVYPYSISLYIREDVASIGQICLGLLIPVFAVAVFGGALQTRFNISAKPLNLNWEKLNPVQGFRNIFSTRGVFRGTLAVTKTILIAVTIFLVAAARIDEIQSASVFSFQRFMQLLAMTCLYSALGTVAIMSLVGIADLAFQQWKHYQELRMSIQDLRDEHKETEGDPMVRARVKRLQSEISRRRMLRDVSRSSVVITNPTHFAVAIRYDSRETIAPVVLAKGADHLAKRIIDIAREKNVPVVERKSVARFLYFNVKLGSQIPLELYQVVAEILNYVKRIKSLV